MPSSPPILHWTSSQGRVTGLHVPSQRHVNPELKTSRAMQLELSKSSVAPVVSALSHTTRQLTSAARHGTSPSITPLKSVSETGSRNSSQVSSLPELNDGRKNPSQGFGSEPPMPPMKCRMVLVSMSRPGWRKCHRGPFGSRRHRDGSASPHRLDSECQPTPRSWDYILSD